MIGAGSRAGDERAGAAHEPLRLCAVSRARKPPEELIRFVAAPDGTIVPDLARRLPGRGVWIDATAAAVAAAVRQKAFARSLKRQVVVPADLSQQVERLLARRLVAALSMANKAGLVAAGFVKVERRLRDGRVFVLLHAAEAAHDGTARLDRIFNALPGSVQEFGDPGPRVIRELTSAELSLAIGQPTVVHAAAAEGGASQRLLFEVNRLRRYRLGALSDRPQGRADAARQALLAPNRGPGRGEESGKESGPESGHESGAAGAHESGEKKPPG